MPARGVTMSEPTTLLESRRPPVRDDLRILVVEDDVGNAVLLQSAMQRAFDSADVQIAGSGAECLSKLRQTSYDCILLDHKLPDTAGIELLGQIRRLEPFVAVIIVTGAGSEAAAVKAMKLGATDYVVKTVDLSYLDLLADIVLRSVEYMRSQRERIRLREELRQSEARYKDLIENSPEMIHQVGADRRFLHVNRTELEQLGYTLEEMLTMRVEQIVPEAERERIIEYFEQVKNSGSATIESAFVAKDGRKIDVEITATALCDAQGRFIKTRAFARDITRRKKLEEQLFQSQKMESIGTLAAGVAHDFNNILATILLAAQMIKMKAKPGTAIFKHADSIEKSAESGGELASQLLSFARAGRCDAKTIDPNSLVREISGLLKRSVEKTIVIELDLCRDVRPILADRNQIAQVLLNLALNAIDAMPQGGRLTFGTENAEVSDEQLLDEVGVWPGQYVKLWVSDTGTGIDKRILGKIFDPFFTTKEVGKGTGLGLSVVYGIVKKHGGGVRVKTSPGSGSVFEVFIPAAAQREKQQKTSTRQPKLGGSERILVVDDRQNVRDSVSQILKLLGFKVLTAPDGRSAVEIYSNSEEKIDLVILDLQMPGMNGLEAFAKLKQVDPNVAVVLSSGYGREKMVAQAALSGIAGFIKKPYRMEQLSEVIRSALAKKRRRAAETAGSSAREKPAT